MGDWINMVVSHSTLSENRIKVLVKKVSSSSITTGCGGVKIDSRRDSSGFCKRSNVMINSRI